MTDLPYRLDRIVSINATPDVVFDFLSESEYWARWWGEGSRIDARPGGEVYIRHPNGIEVTGEVLDVEPGRRIAFTYGFASGKPIASGHSRVEIALTPKAGATELHLTHHFDDEHVRNEHVQGWRYQLSVFANVASDQAHAEAGMRADAWFDAWAEADDTARRRTLERIATPDVHFRDRFSRLTGFDDIVAHIGASIRFMPGMRLVRRGEPRHCQGMALVDWTAMAGDEEKGQGTNVFEFAPDGRITSVTGFREPG